MNRKDFEMVARTLKARCPSHPMIGEKERWLQDVRHFADALEKHTGNANFDRARFEKACGVKA